MSINETIKGDVVIISMKGSTIGDSESDVLRDKVKSLIADGFIKVVLDLNQVRWVNSGALGTMISAMTSLQTAGGDLRIANISDHVQNLFLITQLVKVFKTFESNDRAVASFIVDPVASKAVE